MRENSHNQSDTHKTPTPLLSQQTPSVLAPRRTPRTPLEVNMFPLQAINKGREHMHIKRVTAEDPSVQILSTSKHLLSSLIDLNKDPIKFDPSKHPHALSDCTPSNTTSTARQVFYYLRIYTVPRRVLERYHATYVADQPWSSRMLDQGGGQAITIPYIGITWQSTPLERFQSDQVSNAPSRLTNLIKCGVGEPHVYQWIFPPLDPATPKTIRTTAVYGDLERNLIALVINLALNSASGGFTFEWEPESDFLTELQGLTHDILPIPYPTSTHSKTQQISAHFNTMYKYWKTVQATTHGTLANEEAMQEIEADASSNILPTGQSSTLAAFITKDITEESCQPGFGYSSPAAGPGPALEHRIRSLTGKDIRMPRVDLWPCMPGCPDNPAAVAFLSEYLMVIKPLLVVSHSAVVARTLREDKLSHIWQSQQKCDLFLALSASSALTASLPPPRLADYINTDENYKLKPWPAFTDIVGTLAVIRYGPHARDYAIHIPERHTGSQRYNPATQNAMCELHAVCKVVFTVASTLVYRSRDYLEQSSDQEYLHRLNAIRKAIQNDLRDRGVHSILMIKREAAKQQESELVAMRMGSFHLRSPQARVYFRGNHLQNAIQAAGMPLNEKQMASLPEDVFGEYLDESVPRVQQWKSLMEPLEDALKRGIKPPVGHCPANVEFLSPAHRNWFLTLPEDTYVRQAAIIQGKTLRTKWSQAQWTVYYKQRKDAGIKNRTPFNFVQAMKDLADPTTAKEVKKDKRAGSEKLEYLLLECGDCGVVELIKYNSIHACAADPKGKKETKNNIINGPFRYQKLMYPHQVYDNLTQEQRTSVKELGVFAQQDAAAIIRHSGLPQAVQDQVPVGVELGSIFYLPGNSGTASAHWLNTQAIDRLLQHLNSAVFSAFDRREEEDFDLDDDVYRHHNVSELLNHIHRHLLDPEPKPVLTQCCGVGQNSRCDKWSIYFPCDDSRTATGECKRRQVQHRCAENGGKSMRGIINGGVVVCRLTEFPAPMARRYWHQARSKEYAGGQIKEDVQS
ncbi:hypothetical protein BG000_001677, partial [Podila horticola]